MLKEIYCRNNSDPGYDPDAIETNSALESVLTKIRMIFFTRKGEVAGAYSLGMNLEDALFKFSFNSAKIQEDFASQMAIYVPESGAFRVELKINFVQGSIRDIAYLDIYIDGTKYLGVFAK